jgi:outer membrane protein OmpA-like peptidoglycan-associated protein/tetratricopeptide (TPR) repeat protein
MKKHHIFLFFLLTLSFTLTAQKSKLEKKGDKFFAYYSFQKAVKYYSKVKDLSIESKRKLAESYKNIGNYKMYEEVLSSIIKDEKANTDDFLNFSYALKYNGKYEDAIFWMDKFLENNPNDLRSLDFVKNKNELDKLLKNNGRYKIKNLDINSIHQDFAAAYYKTGKIVFTSSKEGIKNIKRTYSWNQKPFLDLFVADVKSGQFVKPEKLSKILNKKLHEGPASFAKKGTYMAFTKNNYNGKSKDDIIKLQLYFSRASKGEWLKEQPFIFNSPEYSVGHPWLNETGDTLYFSSDMPGGFGGVDLYRTSKDLLGEWEKPVNLGNAINTEGDEMFPFVHDSTKILFFASNGLHGLGGLDVYMVKIKDNGFGPVTNLASPVNTQFDDFAFILNENMSNGYFSSNRLEGKGDDDIYSFQVLIPFVFEKVLTGKAKDSLGNPLSNVIIYLYDDMGTIISTDTSDADGSYGFVVEPDKTFKLSGSKTDYFDSNTTVNSTSTSDTIVSELILNRNHNLSLYFLLTDKISKEKIPNAKVTITDKNNGKNFVYRTSDNGDFIIKLENDKFNSSLDYTIKIEKEGYFNKFDDYKKTLNREGQYNIHEDLDISTIKFKEGMDLAKTLNIFPIYFDYDKFNIRKDAAVELDKIVKVMNENPTMVVELGSHTDCRGTIEYNEKLSARRAESSADYIKKRISNPERIYGKGFGESKPAKVCNCEIKKKDSCTENDHQNNRRTEFIIIKL